MIKRSHSPAKAGWATPGTNDMKKLLAISVLFVALASPAFAQKGYLFVESAPDSAVVTIDGGQSERYYTPVLCTLSVGEHTVEITKRFYETEIFKVKIEPEAVVRKRVDFVRQEKFNVTKPTGMTVEGKYGQLTIITNPHGAEVIADGEKLYMTSPVTLSNVPAGPHRYSIVYHYIQYDTTIIVTGDAPQTAVIDLRIFEGKEMYSIMPSVQTKVVIVVPGCKYKWEDGVYKFKGVDVEIKIEVGDTSLAFNQVELANQFKEWMESANTIPEVLELEKTEFTFIFDPYLDARLQFETVSFASKKKFQLKDEITPSTHYQNFPASLNSGKNINVRIYIEDDGEIVFRYW